MPEHTGRVPVRERAEGSAWGWILGVACASAALWMLVFSKTIAEGIGRIVASAVGLALLVVAWKAGLWLLQRVVFTVSRSWNEGKEAARKG